MNMGGGGVSLSVAIMGHRGLYVWGASNGACDGMYVSV